jgi:hypothetical protein
MSAVSETKPVKFEPGRLLATPGALEALKEASQEARFFLWLHLHGDWGDLSVHDKSANDAALIDGTRILSAYRLLSGVKLWIITEAVDDAGRRPATTILLPEEY